MLTCERNSLPTTMLHNIVSTAVANVSKHHEKAIPLTASEAASGILGSVSLACWIFLLIPQVIENYRNQSAEAISLAFVLTWFLGDVANLLGAAWAGLVPTVIAIAIYFCFSDGVLIGQVLYYGIRNKRREGRGLLESVKTTVVETETGARRFSTDETAVGSTNEDLQRARSNSIQENEPLLSRKHSRGGSYGAYTIPGSTDPKMVRESIARRRSSETTDVTREQIRVRRKSSSTAATSAQQEPLAKIFEETDSTSSRPTSTTRRILRNALSILGVVAIGTLGWLIAYKTGTWKPTPPPDANAQPDPDPDVNPAGAQFLGYVSAVLYLPARLPQIWKNYREQSCEGLSLLFFILSLMGNGTYGAGILCHSLERNYVIKNVPWLIGSLGTMVEDGIVFWQFRLYRHQAEESAVVDTEATPSRA